MTWSVVSVINNYLSLVWHSFLPETLPNCITIEVAYLLFTIYIHCPEIGPSVSSEERYIIPIEGWEREFSNTNESIGVIGEGRTEQLN